MPIGVSRTLAEIVTETPRIHKAGPVLWGGFAHRFKWEPIRKLRSDFFSLHSRSG